MIGIGLVIGAVMAVKENTEKAKLTCAFCHQGRVTIINDPYLSEHYNKKIKRCPKCHYDQIVDSHEC